LTKNHQFLLLKVLFLGLVYRIGTFHCWLFLILLVSRQLQLAGFAIALIPLVVLIPAQDNQFVAAQNLAADQVPILPPCQQWILN
jgi:hypothetical protein